MSAFLQDRRQLLANLAILLHRSRHHEQQLNPSSSAGSIVEQLRHVEHHGVYSILCAIDVAMLESDFEQLQVPDDCDSEQLSRAAVDDRNYLVLYALEKSLQTIIDNEHMYEPYTKSRNQHE